MDHIQAMRVFVRVVETGGFTRAADSLNMPKGTVTKQVQALEARVKVKLLHRTTRHVRVTSDGAAYYERVLRLLADLEELEAGLVRSNAAPAGRLRVDAPSSVAQALLVPAMGEFHERYPDIEVELGVGDATVDLIRDNVDCVVRGGAMEDESLIARRLRDLRFTTVAAPRYLDRYGKPGSAADLLAGHRMVSFFAVRHGRHYPLVFGRAGEREEIAPPRHLSVNDSNAHLAATVAGLGIAQMMRFLAAPAIARGDLVELLPECERQPLPAYVAYPANRHLPAKTRAFVDWVLKLFAEHPNL